MVTYKRDAKGTWVAYGPASEVKIGTITLHKRDGTPSTEEIAMVSPPFAVVGKSEPHVHGYFKGEDGKPVLEPKVNKTSIPLSFQKTLIDQAKALAAEYDRCDNCNNASSIIEAVDKDGKPGMVCRKCGELDSRSLYF